MKKTVVVIISFFIFILCIITYFLFKNHNEIETSYLIREFDETSAYFGKLNYNHKTKKAWISGGYGTILFKEVKKISKNGIEENIAKQKEDFNKHLNAKHKDWRKRNPSFVLYEITSDDHEIKIIKPGDPEFFNSLRYALIKNRGLVEIDEESALKIFKTWFHSVYYFFVSPPPNKTDTYYSTVYPHNAVSWKEMRITVELHD